ncbi:acyltransferase family protein [Arthrobacter sunyaminii]|uniref:Acyltransferase family protein n=1 Tax=Arthrobacter sunyaminii TaxID=2816859 RepID=A0A975S7E1_9MICC|nr:acyltransferase [Arthrobacter sunyaminii]QWQ37199.1 acyltransferase family protein [Arthrobacter sunyaminii]
MRNLLSQRVRGKLVPVDNQLRLDIQGLRAIAVGAVLLYHAGLGWIPGGFVGVDVFFVISGFLITGGIIREIDRTGRLSLVGFYARRAARILPAATVVLVVVVIASYLLMPMTRWLQVGKDAMGSGLYVINWMLANDSIDYLANDQAPSPLQHFWSLAVEEQFYVVWPLVAVVAAWLATRMRRNRKRVMGIALMTLAVPSFAWSLYMVETSSGPAYFVTTTRLWELAVGAGLALLGPVGLRSPKALAAIVGWCGLAAIMAAALTYTSVVPFPGATALLPTVGAAMIIWAGPVAGRFGPTAALGLRPMVWVGTMSYSLYLWHWPLLVLTSAVVGELSPMAGLVVVVASFLPAWMSLRYVEQPALAWGKRARGGGPTLRAGALMSLAAVTAGVLLAIMVPPVPPSTDIEFSASPLPNSSAVPEPLAGASVLISDPSQGVPIESFASITPTAVAASSDVPRTCLQSETSDAVQKCVMGDTDSSTVVAVVGDSHAAMFVPGIAAVASEQGWRLDVYTKGSCPFTAQMVLVDGRPYENCLSWGENVAKDLMNNPPSALIVGTSRYQAAGFSDRSASEDALIQGMRAAWTPFVEAGVPVISLKDAPRPGESVPDCVAQNETELSRCALPRQNLLSKRSPEVEAAEGMTGVYVVDLTDAICPGEMCPAVIGGVLIYRDGNHLTATYSRTMKPQIMAALVPLITPAQ